MKERPIVFAGREVRAMLDGRKTQARRVVRWPNAAVNADGCVVMPPGVGTEQWWPCSRVDGDEKPLRCPYGTPGSKLWVRETFALEHLGEDGERVVYRIDRAARWVAEGETIHYLESSYKPARWTPAVQMPRRLSRLALDVTGVRVQRLQDISEDDACAEGLKVTGPTANQAGEVIDDRPGYLGHGSLWHDPRRAFETIWDSVNGKSAQWSSNPWVWVLEFKRVEQEGAKAA